MWSNTVVAPAAEIRWVAQSPEGEVVSLESATNSPVSGASREQGPTPSKNSGSGRRVWLAVHAWYHPASDNDSYRRSVADSLASVGVPFEILRGRPIPSGPVSQSILPLILRGSMTYGIPDGLVHDLYGDSVFRDVGVSSIQDLYWNSRQDGLRSRSLQLAILSFQAYRRTLIRSKRVIATTPFMRDELLKAYGSQFKDKIRIVPIACEAGIGPGVRPAVYDVLWIGSTLRRKAPTEFLRAVGILPKEFRIALRLRRASEQLSESADAIAELVDRYRQEGRRIDVWSEEMPRPAIEELYRSSKCLVSTSTYEGFHMPVAEAYLRGLNVVLRDAAYYRSMYDGVGAGIHWYSDSRDLPTAIAEAVRNGPFHIDQALRDRLSFRGVGRLLKGVYEEASPR